MAQSQDEEVVLQEAQDPVASGPALEEVSIFGTSEAKLSQPSPQEIYNRALKYDYGLREKSPGKEILAESISNGTESVERTRARAKEILSDEDRRFSIVAKYMDQRKASGRPTSEDEIKLLRTMDKRELDIASGDPETYFEKKFASRVFDENFSNHYYASANDPSILKEVLELHGPVKDHIARKEIFQKIAEQQSAKTASQGTGEFAFDIGRSMLIPFYSTYLNNNRTSKGSSVLQGSNLEEQIKNLWLLPPDEAKRALESALEDLGKIDQTQATLFAHAVTSYGSTDKAIDNIGTVLDATILGGSLFKGIRGFLKTATGNTSHNQVALTSKSGNLGQASLDEVNLELARRMTDNGPANAETWNKMVGLIQPLVNPSSYLSNVPHTLHAGKANSILEILENNAAKLLKSSLVDPVSISRQDGNVFQVAVQDAERLLNIQNGRDAVLSVSVKSRAGDNLVGVDKLEVSIGTPHNMGAFTSEYNARFSAENFYGLKNGSYDVKPEGSGYVISVTKDVDETTFNAMRQLSIETANSTPSSMVNTWAGALRSKDYLVSEKFVQDAKAATYGASNIVNTVREVISETVQPLSKASRKDLASFMTKEQDVNRFSNSFGEFQRNWGAHHGKLPTEEEALAYFTYRQLNDLDYFVNNLNVYRDKARIGLEMHGFDIGRVKTKENIFEGKRIEDLPFASAASADARVMLHTHDGTGGARIVNLSTLTKPDMDAMFSGGYRVIQLSPQGQENLRKVSKATGIIDPDEAKISVNFVVTNKEVRNSPLSIQQIPYVPGGHKITDAPFYISQAKLSTVRNTVNNSLKTFYSGDLNLYAIYNRAQGTRFLERLEAAREFYRTHQGDDAALNAYLQTSGLPYGTSEFKAMFRDNLFDINEPFLIRKADETLGQNYGLAQRVPGFTNSVDSPYNLYADTRLRFLQERGETLNTIYEGGSVSNPVLGIRPAKIIDPEAAISKNTVMMANARQLDNFKIDHAKRYVAEFAEALDVKGRPTMNPVKVLLDGKFKEGYNNKDVLAAAKNYRRSFMELVGQKSNETAFKEYIVQRVSDALYRSMGQKGATFASDYLMSTTTDPAKFLRQVAFHSRLGLFNPAQLLVQSQGLVHIAAISPREALQASSVYTLSRAAMINPDRLDDLSKASGALGWGPGTFKESWEGLVRSGFQNVGGEYAVLDDVLETSVHKSAIGTFLDSGLFFFREGEKFIRHTAWHTSYREWRRANPGATMNDEALRTILSRADDLSVNMSRASNSSWQTGLLSVPTQFWSYQARLMEQLLPGSNKLSAQEKVRAMTAYSMLYGIPVGVTAGVGVWPVHEEIRIGLKERGIDVESSAISKVLHDGLGSVLLGMATGGEKFSVGPKLGPSGIPTFKDLLTGDKEFKDIIMGAGGSTLGGYLTNASPAIASTIGVFSGNQELLPVALEDWNRFFSNISSYDSARKLYSSLTAGSYMTKNGMVVEDVTTTQAIAKAFAGLDTIKTQDLYDMMKSNKATQAHKNEALKEARRYMTLALKTDVVEEHLAFHKQAKAILIAAGFREDELTRELGNILGEFKSLYEKQEQRFNNMTPERQKLHIQKLQKELNNNG